MSGQGAPGALPILLLTPSPLLRAEIGGLLGAEAQDGEHFVLHTAVARERERAMAEFRPRRPRPARCRGRPGRDR